MFISREISPLTPSQKSEKIRAFVAKMRERERESNPRPLPLVPCCLLVRSLELLSKFYPFQNVLFKISKILNYKIFWLMIRNFLKKFL